MRNFCDETDYKLLTLRRTNDGCFLLITVIPYIHWHCNAQAMFL